MSARETRGSADPLLSEIEAQLGVVANQIAVAQQGLANLRAFVTRVNREPEPESPNVDTDGDEEMETYESAPPVPHTGGRNGRKKVQRR